MRQNIPCNDLLGEAKSGGGISPPIQLNSDASMNSSLVYKEGCCVPPQTYTIECCGSFPTTNHFCIAPDILAPCPIVYAAQPL